MIDVQLSVPLVAPLIGEEEVAAAVEVLRSGQLAQGPQVQAFEREFEAAVGSAHAVAMNSGTAANHAALAAFGIGPGDEVLTTPFTFAATASPVLMQGACVRFADIDPRTFNLDPEAALAAAGPNTRAVVLVDLFGLPVAGHGLAALRTRGIRILEDACQAIGASRAGKCAGTLGEAGAFSFYATKNVMTGEGGMLVTDDAAVAAAARRFRHHGQGERYEYVSLGFNYRMTDLSAAIGRVQFGRLAWLTERRQANAAAYDGGLAGLSGVTTPLVPPDVAHAYHQYSILIDAQRTANGADRDGVRAHLARLGVQSGIYYPKPLHLHPLFAQAGYARGDFPIAERVAGQILALPIHPNLTLEQIDWTIAAVHSALGETK